MSDDEVILVVGFESGAIAAYDIVRESRVLILKILFKNQKYHNRLTVLSSDESVQTLTSIIGVHVPNADPKRLHYVHVEHPPTPKETVPSDSAGGGTER
jgi:hypothetical protein